MPSLSRRDALAGTAALAAGLAGCGWFDSDVPDRRVGPTDDPDPGHWPRRDYGVQRNRHNPHATPPRTPPGERWQVDTAGRTTLIVAGGTVYVGDDQRIRALDAADGDERWTRPGGVEKLVFVADRLYAVRDNTVSALDATDGREQWSQSFDGERVRDAIEHYGVLIVTTTNAVYGLHADSGNRLWSLDRPTPSSPLTGSGGAYLQATPTRIERLVLNTTEERFSPETPRFDPWTGYSRRTPAAPVATTDRVYLGGRPPSSVEGGRGHLSCFGRAVGSLEWQRRPAVAHVNSPVVVDGRAYTTGYPPGANTPGGRIVAIDAATGDPEWERDPGHLLSAPVVANHTVYAGGSEPEARGQLYAVDAATGDLLWSRATPGAATTDLAAVGDTLYAADHGAVLALR